MNLQLPSLPSITGLIKSTLSDVRVAIYFFILGIMLCILDYTGAVNDLQLPVKDWRLSRALIVSSFPFILIHIFGAIYQGAANLNEQRIFRKKVRAGLDRALKDAIGEISLLRQDELTVLALSVSLNHFEESNRIIPEEYYHELSNGPIYDNALVRLARVGLLNEKVVAKPHARGSLPNIRYQVPRVFTQRRPQIDAAILKRSKAVAQACEEETRLKKILEYLEECSE